MVFAPTLTTSAGKASSLPQERLIADKSHRSQSLTLASRLGRLHDERYELGLTEADRRVDYISDHLWKAFSG